MAIHIDGPKLGTNNGTIELYRNVSDFLSHLKRSGLLLFAVEASGAELVPTFLRPSHPPGSRIGVVVDHGQALNPFRVWDTPVHSAPGENTRRDLLVPGAGGLIQSNTHIKWSTLVRQITAGFIGIGMG